MSKNELVSLSAEQISDKIKNSVHLPKDLNKENNIFTPVVENSPAKEKNGEKGIRVIPEGFGLIKRMLGVVRAINAEPLFKDLAPLIPVHLPLTRVDLKDQQENAPEKIAFSASYSKELDVNAFGMQVVIPKIYPLEKIGCSINEIMPEGEYKAEYKNAEDMLWLSSKENDFNAYLINDIPSRACILGLEQKAGKPDQLQKAYEDFAKLSERALKAIYNNAGADQPDLEIKLNIPENLDKLEMQVKKLEGMVNANRPAAGSEEKGQSRQVVETFRIRFETEDKFENIIGNEEAKGALREMADHVKDPTAFKKWGVEPPKSLLILGEKGSGKSQLLHALENEWPREEDKTVAINAQDLNGKPPEIIQGIFASIRNLAKKKMSIIMIENIDGLEMNSSIVGAMSSTALIENIAALIDAFKEESDFKGIICTATDENLIPFKLYGRIEEKVPLRKPNENERVLIFKKKIEEIIGAATQENKDGIFGDIDLKEMSRATEGKNAGEINKLLQSVLRRKAREERVAKKQGKNKVLPVTTEDLRTEIRTSNNSSKRAGFNPNTER